MKTFSKNVIFLLCMISLSPFYAFSEENDREKHDDGISLIYRRIEERIKEIESELPDLEKEEKEACLQEKEALENVIASLKEAEEKVQKLKTTMWITAGVGGATFLACVVAGIIILTLALSFRRKINRNWENISDKIKKLHNNDYKTRGEMIEIFGDLMTAADKVEDEDFW